MTNELKKAIGQLKDSELFTKVEQSLGKWRTWFPNEESEVGVSRSNFLALITLAQAYLAEHPADDGEVIDRNWLLEYGLVACGNPNAVRLQRNDDLYMILRDDGQWLPVFQNGLHGWIRLKPITTRGQFRTLLTLLESR